MKSLKFNERKCTKRKTSKSLALTSIVIIGLNFQLQTESQKLKKYIFDKRQLRTILFQFNKNQFHNAILIFFFT